MRTYTDIGVVCYNVAPDTAFPEWARLISSVITTRSQLTAVQVGDVKKKGRAMR